MPDGAEAFAQMDEVLRRHVRETSSCREGHIFELGGDACVECGRPVHEGEPYAGTVIGSDGYRYPIDEAWRAETITDTEGADLGAEWRRAQAAEIDAAIQTGFDGLPQPGKPTMNLLDDGPAPWVSIDHTGGRERRSDDPFPDRHPIAHRRLKRIPIFGRRYLARQLHKLTGV